MRRWGLWEGLLGVLGIGAFVALVVIGCETIPLLTPTPTATATRTPTATATATQTPTPTATPDLYQEISPPEHMAFIWWGWNPGERERGFEELEIAFTIHNDPEGLPDGNGLYFMACWGKIAGTLFYFGLQKDYFGIQEHRGKRAVFSRWDTRDLNLARFSAEDGLAQSSGHEGGFHRGASLFGLGGPETTSPGSDAAGEWYGLWITDVSTESRPG